MSKNLMPEVAKLLGVEIGEEFEIKELEGYFFFDKDNLYQGFRGLANAGAVSNTLNALINGKLTIIKQPKLSQAERVILENLPKEYEWITRDEIKSKIIVYKNKPGKIIDTWSWVHLANFMNTRFDFIELPFRHLFQFIKWEDEEPYNIEKLLKG